MLARRRCKLAVFEPDGTTELERYYLNSSPLGFHEAHQTIPIGYEVTLKVPGQGVIEYFHQDPDCRAINNCGEDENFNHFCHQLRNVPNEDGLALPTQYGGQSVDEMNIVSGANQPYHAQLVHVTVTSVFELP